MIIINPYKDIIKYISEIYIKSIQIYIFYYICLFIENNFS